MQDSYATQEPDRATKIKRQLKKQKIHDTLSVLWASVGWIWEYSEYEKYYDQISYVGPDSKGSFSVLLKDEDEEALMSVLRIGVTLTTFLLLYSIFRRYEAKIEIMKLTGRIPLLNYTKGETKNQHIIPSFYWNVHKWMILEMVILLFHSLPFVNFNFETSYQGFYLAYNIDIILSVAMNVRVYLLVRLVKHYSKWMNKDAEAVCQTQGIQADLAFGFKAFRKEHPLILICVLLIILIIVAGFSMRALERSFKMASGLNWDNYLNSIWCTFVLITTVGYGDFYPKTPPGRVVAIFACIAGQFFVSLMVTTITSMVEFTAPQNRAFHKIKAELLNQKLEMIRTNVIKYAFKRYRDKKEGKPGDKNHMKLMRNLKAIVQVKKEISANKINTPFEITVNQCKRAISEKKFDTIAIIRKKMSDVSARITKLEDNWKLIEKRLSLLHNYNYNILNTLQKVEKESTQQVSFDKLKLNPRALDIIDELPILNSFAETSLQEISDFDPEGLLKSGNSSAVLDEKKKRKLMNRIQKAELKIDKELFNMEKDDNLPHIPLRHKRVMANNNDAKKKLKMFIDVKQRVKEVSKKKPAYISGDILGKTILEFNDIEEKSPVALLGSIKLDENEEENDSGLGKLTSLILASKKRRKQRKAKTIAEIGERSEKKLNLFPVEMIDTNEDCTISERKVEKEYVLASLDEEIGMNEEITNTNKRIQTYNASPLGNNHTKSILKPRTFKRTNTDLGSQTIGQGKFPISQQEKQNFLILEEIKTQAITEQPIINKPAAEYIEGFDSLQTTTKPKANTVEIKEEDKIIRYEETKSGYISSDGKIGSKSSFLKERNSHFYEICYNYEDNNKVLVRKNTLEIDLYERNLQKGSQTQNNQTYQKELMFGNTPAYQSDLSPSLSLAEIKQEVMKVAPTLEKIKNEPISPNKPIFLGNILSPELKSTFNSQQSISNPYKRQESVHNNNPSKSILRLVGEEVVKDKKMMQNISQFGLKSPEGQRIRNDYSTPSTGSITQSKKNSEIRKDNNSPSRDSVISVFNTLNRNKEGVIEPFYKARKNNDLKNLNGKSPSIQDTVLDEETLDIPGNYLVKNLNNRKEKDSSQLGGRGASRKEDRLDFLSYFKYKQW